MGRQIPKGKQLNIFFKTQLPSKPELWMGSWRAERQQLGSLRDQPAGRCSRDCRPGPTPLRPGGPHPFGQIPIVGMVDTFLLDKGFGEMKFLILLKSVFS